jgi:hypothetical protein
MPLYENAFNLIRSNFERIAQGGKPLGGMIGTLTAAQLESIHRMRA